MILTVNVLTFCANIGLYAKDPRPDCLLLSHKTAEDCNFLLKGLTCSFLFNSNYFILFYLTLINFLLQSLPLQIGGNWQWAAVALLKEMLLNRCMDIQVMVELHINVICIHSCLTLLLLFILG